MAEEGGFCGSESYILGLKSDGQSVQFRVAERDVSDIAA